MRAVHRHPGLFSPGKPCPPFREYGYWQDKVVRETDTRGRSPSDPGDLVEDLLQGHVPLPQDVSFSGLPPLECENMPGGHVFHVHDVQAGVNIGGHVAGHGFDDQAPGRCGLEVSGPDRVRRVYDECREIFARSFVGI